MALDRGWPSAGDELVDLYTGTGVMGRVAQLRTTGELVLDDEGRTATPTTHTSVGTPPVYCVCGRPVAANSYHLHFPAVPRG